MQTKIKLNEQQLATLSSPKAVNEYLEHHRENIKNLIKQNLAVGDIYRRENLQVYISDLSYVQYFIRIFHFVKRR
jgi:hypothetical protein